MLNSLSLSLNNHQNLRRLNQVFKTTHTNLYFLKPKKVLINCLKLMHKSTCIHPMIKSIIAIFYLIITWLNLEKLNIYKKRLYFWFSQRKSTSFSVYNLCFISGSPIWFNIIRLYMSLRGVQVINAETCSLLINGIWDYCEFNFDYAMKLYELSMSHLNHIGCHIFRFTVANVWIWLMNYSTINITFYMIVTLIC